VGNERTVGRESASGKRPGLVWVIFIYYMVRYSFSILSVTLISDGVIPVNSTIKAFFDSWSASSKILILIESSLNIAGAVFLFLLRRHAYYYLLAALGFVILMDVYAIVINNWLTAIGSSGLVDIVKGWLIGIAVIFYSRYLIKKGILK
jgi:hypothetical protein